MTAVPTSQLGQAQDWREALAIALSGRVRERISQQNGTPLGRKQIAGVVSETLDDLLMSSGARLLLSDQRRLVETLTDQISQQRPERGGIDSLEDRPRPIADQSEEGRTRNQERTQVVRTKVLPVLMERMDVTVAARLSSQELESQVQAMVSEIQAELRLQLNATEIQQVVRVIVDDMLGLGPLEPLLDDDAVSDIMVNGPNQIYVERKGKLELADDPVPRRGPSVARSPSASSTRSAAASTRSTPLVDARLPDGSRVNVIIPPLALRRHRRSRSANSPRSRSPSTSWSRLRQRCRDADGHRPEDRRRAAG